MPRKKPSSWQPFERAHYPYPEMQRIIRQFGLPQAQNLLSFEIWLNNKYQVALRRQKDENPNTNLPDLIHLSIKRRDNNPVRDWRDLQRIKNELVGPECEGVELFPAESRLVDTANQLHLWVWDDPTFRFPIGFNEGRIVSNAETNGSRQRRHPDYPDELPPQWQGDPDEARQ